LLDFAVICDTPNERKYESVAFPEGDIWGLILPADAPLAEKAVIQIDDLVGLPLFTSQQGWEGDIREWAGERFKELHLEGSFRLAYNASMFVREGLGYQLSFRNLVDVSENSGLTFRPLFPTLETRLYLIWNRYQTFTPIAERFLAQVRNSF
jgi:DNA-binding transcriptional LysR family regulator